MKIALFLLGLVVIDIKVHTLNTVIVIEILDEAYNFTIGVKVVKAIN